VASTGEPAADAARVAWMMLSGLSPREYPPTACVLLSNLAGLHGVRDTARELTRTAYALREMDSPLARAA
jgi:hypothetical protein